MLKISNLTVEIDGQVILKNLNLHIQHGEVHSIMGPNGSGKSTLLKIISGHPDCTATSGSLLYCKEPEGSSQDLLKMDPVERAREGIFMSFQHPVEVPGVDNLSFLRESFNSICKHLGAEEMDEESFSKLAMEKAQWLNIDPTLLKRPLNEGLSGGEKKKNELIQMAVLSPTLALLDEIDSGIDIDSIKTTAEGLKKMQDSSKSIVLITHYHRLLKDFQPDYVHILIDGQIKQTGDYSLAKQLDQTGYDSWLKQ